MLNEDQSRSTEPRNAAVGRPGLPGASAAILIAGLSGGLFGYWAWTGVGRPAQAAGATGSLLAEVDAADMTDALGTVASSPEQIARFRQRPDCERRLAWVTVARGAEQLPGRIRLQSGAYFSPLFDLGEAPVRVALPFPAPYLAGRGTISVLGTTADAIVALSPPWHVAAQPGPHAVQVTWIPIGCPKANP